MTGGDINWETVSIERPDYDALASRLAGGTSPVWSSGKVLLLQREDHAWLLAVCLARVRS